MISEFSSIKKFNVSFLKKNKNTNKDNEIECGIWWEGECALSRGTHNSAGVATLFSVNMNVNILNVE